MKNILQMLKTSNNQLNGLILLLVMTFLCHNTSAQNKTITGKVIDAKNETLPGVSVLIKGTNNGTITDVNGAYTLSANEEDILQFSYIGYATQLVPVSGRSIIDLTLEEDVAQLDEIVVVGYGTQKKSHLTGAISKITNTNLDQIAVSRVDDALIGQVSGVNVQATSAEAGVAPTITIRGFGSISGATGPAVVVDGVIVNSSFLGNLDMNDIESFEVLKDAASAAIYGSEGSNGVILITTKSGKEGKTKFSYNMFTGYKEAFGSDEYRKNTADWAAKELAATGELSNSTLYALDIVEKTGIDRDWQDVFFDGGTINSHSLSARGGTKSTKFSTSLRFVDDQGVVITDSYRLYSAKLKMDTQINEKLKFGISATPSYSKRRRLPTSIHNPIRQSPWLPIHHTEETLQYIDRSAYPDIGIGDYFREDHLLNLDFIDDGINSTSRPRTSGDQNPYAQFIEREHYEIKTNVLASTYLRYKILDNLTVKSSLGITFEQRKQTRYDGIEHDTEISDAYYSLRNRTRTRIVSDNTINYTKEIGNHIFSGLAGITIQKRRAENSQIDAQGFSNDLLKNIQGATSIIQVQNAESNVEINKIGYFGRVTYAYRDKYLFNASFRRDGSSVFGVDSKWGNFPAVSIGWNASDEDFLSGIGVLSHLKLRVSYGLTGNENFNIIGAGPIGNALAYLSLLNNSNAVNEGGLAPGVSPANIANEELQWESSVEFNPAIDFGFFDNRITGSLDYYVRTSDNLLLANPVSYVTGFNSGIVNLGEVRNSGLELELRTKNYTNNDFSWSSTIVASTNKNELLEFGESDGQLSEDTFGRNSQWINSVGNPISSFYGFVVDRQVPLEYVTTPWIPINGTAQDVIVKDLNGDGIITDDDKTILGDPYADLIWSFTNEFKYGNFDLSIMIQGSLGAEVKNIGDQYFETQWQGATTSPAQLVTDGVIGHTSFLQEKVLTDDQVQSANYFSLRNVNFGYTLPSEITSKYGVGNLRVYISGQNLIYKTSDEYEGFNPEYIDTGNTPTSYGSQRAGSPLFRTVTAGLSLQF